MVKILEKYINKKTHDSRITYMHCITMGIIYAAATNINARKCSKHCQSLMCELFLQCCKHAATNASLKP